MSLFTPSRRWQPAFYPFKKEKPARRWLARMERLVKGPLYGCRMCGNCLLQETAFICPMECPKGLRNGPCGGATAEKCYVDETRKCIWYSIYEKSFRTGREKRLLEVLPPLDWDKAGTETWGDVLRQVRKVGPVFFFRNLLSGNQAVRENAWESVFQPVRQPPWWAGDSEYHPPKSSEPASDLERQLRCGKFVVTTEIIPPQHANTDRLKQNIELVKPYVAAVNFTDSASAIPRMSSLSSCTIAHRLGAEPVLQVTARDNSRTGLQSRITGANALGIHNILCLSGDSPRMGSSPTGSMDIFDLDSVQMLWILRRMRDDGIYLDGRMMKFPPQYFLGAAASPFASEPHFQALREEKKVNAGAQFLQTNLVFETERLSIWLDELYKRKILDRVFILVGIAPLRSLSAAKYLQREIPGVQIAEKIISRLEKAGESAQEEGILIALEIIESVRNKGGVNGIHIMTMGCESSVGRLVKEAGL